MLGEIVTTGDKDVGEGRPRAPWDRDRAQWFQGAQSDHRSYLTVAPAWRKVASCSSEPSPQGPQGIGDLFSLAKMVFSSEFQSYFF